MRTPIALKIALAMASRRRASGGLPNPLAFMLLPGSSVGGLNGRNPLWHIEDSWNQIPDQTRKQCSSVIGTHKGGQLDWACFAVLQLTHQGLRYGAQQFHLCQLFNPISELSKGTSG